ncbi:MAG: outer membrane protein [Desulfovibrionaceae bacterium]
MKNIYTIVILVLVSFFFMPLNVLSVFASEPPVAKKRVFYEENKLGFFGLASVKVGYSHVMSSITVSNLPFLGSMHVDKATKGAINTGVAGTLGYKFTPLFGIRTELELLFRTRTEMNSSTLLISPIGVQKGSTRHNLTIGTLLVNWYLDFYVTKKIALYTGFGVGMGMVRHISMDTGIFKDITFSWNVNAGTMITVLKFLVIDIGVRYSDFGTINDGSRTLLVKNAPSAIEVLAGISYKF